MNIYGVALLAACFLIGKMLGNALGALMGIDGDIGGVGFAMLLLIGAKVFMTSKGWISGETRGGILFWSSMFIPIVVAMSAIQNVQAALTGGWVALFAGVGATAAGVMLVPLISRIGKDKKLPGGQHTFDGDN